MALYEINCYKMQQKKESLFVHYLSNSTIVYYLSNTTIHDFELSELL